MPRGIDTMLSSPMDPTLLPHLARVVSLQQLPSLLDVAERIVAEAFPAWPRLTGATCSVVASRIAVADDEAVVKLLLNQSSTLYSYLDTSLLDSAIDSLTTAADESGDAQWAVRACRVAAIQPDYEDGMLVDLASSALLNLESNDALAANAHFLPLTSGTERRSIIDAWLETDRFEPAEVQALFAAAERDERSQLTTALLANLDDGMPPSEIVSIVSTVLPLLSEAGRSRALDRLAIGMQSAVNRLPPWWLSLAWSRICACEADIAVDLGELESVWRQWLESFKALPPNSGFADVMRAHPGSADWMSFDAGDALSEEQAGRLLDNISSRWGAREMAAAPPPASRPRSLPDEEMLASAPPSEPGPVPRGGGLGNMLGGLFGRLLDKSDKTDSAERPATRGMPPEASAETQPDRRLQADVRPNGEIDQGRPEVLTRAFVAGTKHSVDLSVGRGGSLRLDATFVEPEFSEDKAVEELELRFIYNDTVTGGTVNLPRDSSSDSDVWTTAMEVPADAEKVDATVAVLHNGRVLQAAKLTGPVEPTLSAATSGAGEIKLEVTANVHDFTNLDDRNSFDASVLTDGKSGAAFSGAKIGVRELNGVDDTIRKLTNKLFKATEAVAMSGVDGDPRQFEKLLVFLAAHGKVLHSVLIKQLMPSLDAAKRIQIVSSNPSAILPLEFVYSGPSPAHTAVLCDGWKKALETGVCPSCVQAPGNERSPTICPLHFWALSKIIERHAATQAGASGPDFTVGTRVAGTRDKLAPLKRALFAASDNVPEELVDETLAVLNEATESCESVDTWVDWSIDVQADSPTLLVGMPHNALDPVLEISTLEIGGGSELRAGEVTREYICHDNAQVGPVVLLLGCQTAHGGPQPFHTFVGEFRNNGAAMVIGTLATVLGEHAAPIVQAIVQELAKPAGPGENTFGDLLLRIRRHMFARGILIALAVAAFGDADWELVPQGD